MVLVASFVDFSRVHPASGSAACAAFQSLSLPPVRKV
jgi:hypothetical protein